MFSNAFVGQVGNKQRELAVKWINSTANSETTLLHYSHTFKEILAKPMFGLATILVYSTGA